MQLLMTIHSLRNACDNYRPWYTDTINFSGMFCIPWRKWEPEKGNYHREPVYYCAYRIPHLRKGQAMIKNQWYAVLSSHQLKKGQVLGARRFGENLVFYRTGKGQIGCANGLCPHRKASLAKGRMEKDHIKCPFHGIEYDATGKCVYIPSEGKAAAADYARFHLESYPVREIGGIVFVWYGDEEPSGEPDYFDVMVDKSFTYDQVDDLWNVDYSRVIENQLDVSHLAFVHHNTIGRGGKTLCNGPMVRWLDGNTMQTSANNEKDNGQDYDFGLFCPGG